MGYLGPADLHDIVILSDQTLNPATATGTAGNTHFKVAGSGGSAGGSGVGRPASPTGQVNAGIENLMPGQWTVTATPTPGHGESPITCPAAKVVSDRSFAIYFNPHGDGGWEGTWL
jgi:hypothetical protein